MPTAFQVFSWSIAFSMPWRCGGSSSSVSTGLCLISVIVASWTVLLVWKRPLKYSDHQLSMDSLSVSKSCPFELLSGL